MRRVIAALRSEPSRVCLWTIYSLGLRLSEGVSPHVGDLDAAHALVHVHRGKGSVDRYVPLPASALETLRQYWTTHRNPRLLFPALGRGRKEHAHAQIDALMAKAPCEATGPTAVDLER